MSQNEKGQSKAGPLSGSSFIPPSVGSVKSWASTPNQHQWSGKSCQEAPERRMQGWREECCLLLPTYPAFSSLGQQGPGEMSLHLDLETIGQCPSFFWKVSVEQRKTKGPRLLSAARQYEWVLHSAGMTSVNSSMKFNIYTHPALKLYISTETSC